jgi:hypothetical protein
MESEMRIETYSDAETLVLNSGVYDWEWGGDADVEGLADFVYHNPELFEEEITDEGLYAYLVSVGEDPADYNVRRSNPPSPAPAPAPSRAPYDAEQWRAKLIEMGASHEVLVWATGRTAAECWDACPRGEWLMWMFDQGLWRWPQGAMDAYDAQIQPLESAYEAQIQPLESAYETQIKPLYNTYKLQIRSIYAAYRAQIKLIHDTYLEQLDLIGDEAQHNSLYDTYESLCSPLDDAYLAQRQRLDDAYEAELKPLNEAYKTQVKPFESAYEAQRADLIRSLIPNPFTSKRAL